MRTKIRKVGIIANPAIFVYTNKTAANEHSHVHIQTSRKFACTHTNTRIRAHARSPLDLSLKWQLASQTACKSARKNVALAR